METSRREMIALGTLLGAVAATGSARAAIAPAPPGLLEVLHVHADAQGITHARRITVQAAKPIPVTSVSAGTIGAGVTEWGAAPSKRFSINITGDIEAELADGTRHRIGKGDLIFIDDKGSKGHRTHMLTPVASLFLMVPDDFDVLAWAGVPKS